MYNSLLSRAIKQCIQPYKDLCGNMYKYDWDLCFCAICSPAGACSVQSSGSPPHCGCSGWAGKESAVPAPYLEKSAVRMTNLWDLLE